MRIAAMIAVVVALAGVARADDKLVKTYAGQIVISPDPVPTEASELAEFVKINVTDDHKYALIKGSPWTINLVGFLTKDRGTGPVVLVFSDVEDAKATPIDSFEVSSRRRVVISTAKVTVEAGFVEGKTYLVRLMRGKATLAKAELQLRD